LSLVLRSPGSGCGWLDLEHFEIVVIVIAVTFGNVGIFALAGLRIFGSKNVITSKAVVVNESCGLLRGA
jgi:hypothetical protein